MTRQSLSRILFRERAVRALLAESERKKDWIWLKDLTDRYGLPYHKTRNFFSQLARKGLIRWRQTGRRWNPLLFTVTDEGIKILRAELNYASLIE